MTTNIEIKAAKPKDKPYKLKDEKGLYLLINPKGGKLWRFDFRFQGKRKTLYFGVYPDVSLADARERRDDARKLLAQKPAVDPSEVKKSQKQAIYGKHQHTFEALTREWAESYFINKSASHKERTLRRLEIYIFPWLGSRPITEITAPEVLQVIKRPQNQGKLETAHRTLQAVGQVMC